MLKFSIIYIMLVMTFSSNCNATSKEITSKSVDLNKSDRWVQYVKKGAEISNEGTSFVAIVDPSDHSILVTTRDVSDRENVYYHFIPGDQITFTFSADTQWDNEKEALVYSYQLHSSIASLVPIWAFKIQWMNDCLEISKPVGWLSRYDHPDRKYSWSKIYSDKILMPGETLTGAGLVSRCPPALGKLEVWGDDIKLGENGIDEFTGDILYGVAGQHMIVEDLTIVPGPCPEKIEPVEWINRISLSLWLLSKHGYIDSEAVYTIDKVINYLKGTLDKPEEQTLEKLTEHTNFTLTKLEDFKDKMQPEAWSYITENLRFVLRNLDIVKFKYYP